MKCSLSEIEIICKTINASFSFINSGGCGVFASILSNELNKIKVDNEVWILCTNYDSSNYYEKYKRMLGYRKKNSHIERTKLWQNNIHLDHVVVKIGKYYFDSTGICEVPYDCEDGLAYPVFQLTTAEINQYAEETHGWNDWFKRHQIPAMKKKMARLFNIMNGTVEPKITDKIIKAQIEFLSLSKI